MRHDDQDSAGHAGCAEAMRRLYVYLDGELDDAGRQVIRRHLDECLPCLGAFDFEAELRVMIATKCREHVPQSLRIRISQVVQREMGIPGWDPFGLGQV
jgi:mycothiol system anti-sigma-R factor